MPHEPNASLGTMDGRRDGGAAALLGRGSGWRLVTRPSPADHQRAWAIGRRLSRGQPAGARPTVTRYHTRRFQGPGSCRNQVSKADARCLGHRSGAQRNGTRSHAARPDPERSGDADATGPDPERSRDAYAATGDANPAADSDSAHTTAPALARRLRRCGRAAHSSEISWRMVPASRSNAWR